MNRLVQCFLELYGTATDSEDEPFREWGLHELSTLFHRRLTIEGIHSSVSFMFEFELSGDSIVSRKWASAMFVGDGLRAIHEERNLPQGKLT